MYISYDSVLLNPDIFDSETCRWRVVTLKPELLQLNWRDVTQIIQSQLAAFLEESGCERYVIGLSGGLDSSTAATLAVRAVGTRRVTGLFLPDHQVTPSGDTMDAESLAEKLKIRTYSVTVTTILNSYSTATPFFERNTKVANGNLRARIRMSLLYYYANMENALVLGTGDRSEILIGYFTKYGDGGTDLLPLGDLYKTQVKGLARSLRVPNSILSKPSSPRLWIGHTARDELGLDYAIIDLILHGFFDLRYSKPRIARELHLSVSAITQLLERNRLSEHKRNLPPSIMVRNHGDVKSYH